MPTPETSAVWRVITTLIHRTFSVAFLYCTEWNVEATQVTLSGVKIELLRQQTGYRHKNKTKSLCLNNPQCFVTTWLIWMTVFAILSFVYWLPFKKKKKKGKKSLYLSEKARIVHFPVAPAPDFPLWLNYTKESTSFRITTLGRSFGKPSNPTEVK